MTTVIRILRIGLLSGLIAGLVVATIATLLDWRLNPGGIFRGAGGNNWPVIAETAFSWWWPVALATALAIVALLAFTDWLRRFLSARR